MRRRATQHMRLHAAEYEPFLGDAAGWTRYIADMEQAGNWGDELTLVRDCRREPSRRCLQYRSGRRLLCSSQSASTIKSSRIRLLVTGQPKLLFHCVR